MSTHDKHVVVIVDPYSSGKYLVQEMKDQNWPMIAVQSTQELAGFWLQQLEPQYFLKVIQHTSLEQTMKELEGYQVEAVCPGSEPGVFLSEDLQESLKIERCNGSATKQWRRHKFDMQERLREVGIRAVRQIYAKTAEEACAWQKEGNFGLWPIIVKPAMSGGTDGVWWCHSEEDVKKAFDEECGKVNVNGELNDCLLAQEFLDGIEYIVDCCSNGVGRHVVCGMWEYHKERDTATKSITYHGAKLMESKGELQESMIQYVWSCLDALDIKYGASHSEVIITSTGPCLVETGARMHGLKGPIMTQLGTGLGIHELVADVAVNNGRLFDELHADNYRYMRKKFACEQMFRNTKKGGTLTREIDEDGFVSNLPSIIAVHPTVHVGDELSITRDLATAPGCFMQLHPNWSQIEADLKAIRDAELSGKLYHTTERTSVNSVESDDIRKFSVSPLMSSPKGSKMCASPNGRISGASPTRGMCSDMGEIELLKEMGNEVDFDLSGMDDVKVGA